MYVPAIPALRIQTERPRIQGYPQLHSEFAQAKAMLECHQDEEGKWH